MSKIYWMGSNPTRCQLTGEPLGDVMYDANTGRGWGNIGQEAFDKLGCRLGVGYGQKYERQENGKWLMVEGGSEE